MSTESDWTPQRISFNRNDGLPKYIAIARALALAITEQELRAGEPLPSQKELAESFGVTVMTVRQAIQTLTEQDLVSTEQGKGTYVRSQPYRLPMGPLASFAAQIKASGRTLRTEVLGFSDIEISPIEKSRMSLPSSRAFELVRLRYVDGAPLVLQTSLLPPSIGAHIDVTDLETRSLYEVLYDDFGIRIGRATETVQAVSLDSESAGLLNRPEGDAALLSARLTYSADGVAVVDDRALTAGENVVVSAERLPDDSGLVMMLSSDSEIAADDTLPFVRGGR